MRLTAAHTSSPLAWSGKAHGRLLPRGVMRLDNSVNHNSGLERRYLRSEHVRGVCLL